MSHDLEQLSARYRGDTMGWLVTVKIDGDAADLTDSTFRFAIVGSGMTIGSGGTEYKTKDTFDDPLDDPSEGQAFLSFDAADAATAETFGLLPLEIEWTNDDETIRRTFRYLVELRKDFIE